MLIKPLAHKFAAEVTHSTTGTVDGTFAEEHQKCYWQDAIIRTIVSHTEQWWQTLQIFTNGR
jgi:hypothetical protein